MNAKQLIFLSCVAPFVLAASTAMAQMRGHSAAMPSMQRPSMAAPTARAPMQRTPRFNSTSGFHRFNNDRFRRRVIFVNDFGFGFPFFGFPFGYPYYGYPYGGYGYPYGGYGYPYGGYGYPYGAYGSYGYGGYGSSGYGAGYSGGYGRSGSLVVEVQRRLANAGYYSGRIDGIAGSGTRSAIRAYERSRGLPVDGAISRRLLAAMGLA